MEIRFDKKAKKFIEAQQIASMVDMLPENDQRLAYELVKKLVLAWDPDFTKVTPQEATALAEAEENFRNGEYVTTDQINWN